MAKSYVIFLAALASFKCEAFRTKYRTSDGQSADVSSEKATTDASVDVGPGTANSEDLLCNLFDGKTCEHTCMKAMPKISLPPFPKDFFGGLSIDDRVAGKDALADVEEYSSFNKNGMVYVEEQDAEFAVSFDMQAYFSCYTRSKWPLFNAWVVDPKLQRAGGKVARVGSFKNPKKEGEEFKAFHAMYRQEYLRAGDVKGVWSDYFGFDQGHWAPDAPFRKKKKQVASTYYFINVSPQTACLNRQEWEHLESNVREWSLEVNDYISVMAGPLERLPQFFLDSSEKVAMWANLLDQWRTAGEVLMRGVQMSSGMKDPHWVEVIDTDPESGRHCILRGKDELGGVHGTDREELKDLKETAACEVSQVVEELEHQALYLMTQAGKKGYRRGVRIPLAYWKVVSWPDPENQDEQLYCCWLMDQTGFVNTDSGSNCLDTVQESADVVPRDKMQYASRETCERLYTPRGSAQGTQDCDFESAGIGWRGKYLVEELHTELDESKR